MTQTVLLNAKVMHEHQAQQSQQANQKQQSQVQVTTQALRSSNNYNSIKYIEFILETL